MTENKISEALKRMERRAEIALKHTQENPNDEKIEAWKQAVEHYTCAAEALREIPKYRAIGTVEECRAAVEKQTATKPHIWGDGNDDDGNIIYDMYDCPSCGKSYEIDYDDYKYCPECGQAIDWSDNNEK